MNESPYSQPPVDPYAPPPLLVRVRVPQFRPLWTYVILALNIVIFIASFVVGQNLILAYGAKINEAIVAGEFWRLVTAMFLHVDWMHIGFNSYALLIFGLQVERFYGQPRFLLLYFLGGLGGSALSFLLSPSPSVGASGAIFALIGVLGGYYFRYRNQSTAGRSRLGNILFVVFYNLTYGFVVPGIDNWAHIGGLLVGLTLGWLLAPNYQIDPLGPYNSPQVRDQNTPQRWLLASALVSLAIGLVIALGMIRWG